MNRRALAVSLASAFLFAALPARAEERSETFLTYCAVCHGEDGKAQTEEGKKKHARNFTDKKFQAAVDDARLEKSITKGRDKMPSFAKKLEPDQIKALVKEVRSFAK